MKVYLVQEIDDEHTNILKAFCKKQDAEKFMSERLEYVNKYNQRHCKCNDCPYKAINSLDKQYKQPKCYRKGDTTTFFDMVYIHCASAHFGDHKINELFISDINVEE